MLITKEIPRPQWRQFLDDLSRLHAGATARLVVLDDEQGVQSHGDTFTLLGLTSDGDPPHASIAAMLTGRSHITHLIDKPASMHIELSWEARTANIQITARNGVRTLISLGPPVLAREARHGRALVATAAAGASAAAGARTFPADPGRIPQGAWPAGPAATATARDRAGLSLAPVENSGAGRRIGG